VSVAILVPLGVLGGPAFARGVSAGHSGSSQYQYKVALCHHTHSRKHPFHVIRIAAPAVRAHMRHGDTLAPCVLVLPIGKHGHGHGKGGDDHTTTTAPTTTTTTVAPAPSHGHSGDHGKSDDHGQDGAHGQSGDHGHGHGK
jgi:hypothetical protein